MLLADGVRWQLVSMLAHSDLRVHELVQGVRRPQNLVSYHLKQLRRHGLVAERRSSADARDIYYSLDLDRLRSDLFQSGLALHAGFAPPRETTKDRGVPRPPRTVLFLCTHNSARSQMAEAIVNATAGPRVRAYSAGIEPTGVHPAAVAALAELDIALDRPRSKSIDEFAGTPFDLVVTVCDSAREACPAYPGARAQVHWSMPDPAASRGSASEIHAVFVETARAIQRRVRFLLADFDDRVAGVPPLPAE